jgi:hypothetical protein
VEIFKGSRSAIEEFYLETVVKEKKLLMTGGLIGMGIIRCKSGEFYVDSARIQPFLEAVKLT